MKRFFLILFAAWVTLPAIAQKTLPAFGKIDIEDLRLKTCPFEPDASAMKLFDVQEIEFDPGEYVTKLTTEKRVRIKIFNEKGYSNATIRIPYYGSKKNTKIKDLSGAIYNTGANGEVVVRKLEKKDFFREKPEDDTRVINFTFPDLKPGSVVEFRYTKIEKDIIQIDPWVVQDKMPVAYAVTTLKVPSEVNVKEKVYGADTIRHTTKTQKHGILSYITHTYQQENIPAFDPEPLMSSYNDNLLRVIFLMIPDNFFLNMLTQADVVWEFTGNTLLSSGFFGGQIRKTIPGTEKLIDSAKNIHSISQRIGFLYRAVQKKIPDKTEQTFYPNSLTDAWNNGSGNTAEINLIFLNLLKKAGVPAWPLLISTRSHGKINIGFPSSGQFNGVDVVAVDSASVFIMDPSLKYQLYQDPPPNIMNREAFLLDSAKMEWIMIDDKRSLMKEAHYVTGSLKDNGEIEGNGIIAYYNYAKSALLDSTSKDDDEEDDDEKMLDKKQLGVTILSTTQENIENDSLPLEQHVSFNYAIQNTGDFYFINPQFLLTKEKNPFTKDKRNTNIDFGSNQQFLYTFKLQLPPSFEIEKLPKNITVRAPDSTFFYRRTITSDAAGLYYSQTFEVHQAVFDKEDYPGLKDFFSRIYALMAEEIILKKKK